MADLPDTELTWDADGHPVSGRFGDVYFSGDGKAETRHVFLDGIGAPACWQGKQAYAIGETGFGTGLNFLMTWALWRATAAPDACLDFVSVEGYPLAVEEMARAHEGLGDLAPQAAALRDRLPPRLAGFHAVELDGGRVRLLLLYGEAASMLSGLAAGIDAWYLDGFAPSKNPEMWSPELLAEIARLSRSDARIATFTAAGQVRRDLTAAGFAMTKRPGLIKRESLAGVFEGRPADDPVPWFAPALPVRAGASVAVIGGGIAGATAARSLAAAGFAVTVLDASGPGAGASGTPAAVVQPRPLSGVDANASFHAAAFRRAVDLYDELENAGHGVWCARGLLSLGRDGEDADRYRRLAESGILGPDAAQWLDAEAAETVAGVAAGRPGSWFSAAGALATRRLLDTLLAGTEVRRGDVAGLAPADDGWRLLDAAGGDIVVAEAVVVATGHGAQGLLGFQDLGLFANRGQVTRIEGAGLETLRAPVSFGGYLVPDGEGAVIGSTFRRIEDAELADWRAPDPEDDAANIALLQAGLGIAGISATESWVGLRATTRDRFPILGPVPDHDAYAEDYAALRHGPKAGPFPAAAYRPGLFVFSGLGARGFLTAPLAADILAAQMAGRPAPQPRGVLDAMHPARFLVHKLRRSGA